MKPVFSAAPAYLRARWRPAISLFFLLLSAAPSRAQETHDHTLKAADYDAETFVPPTSDPAKGGSPVSARIVVSYTGFTPEAQVAFQYAASIWETHISSPITIRVEATFEPLEERTLGAAGPAFVQGNFSSEAQANTWYPIAIAEAIANTDYTGPEADIVASFNSDFDNWYFGTDGQTPAGQYDFTTVVLHELGHGLGFLGTFDVNDGDPETGEGCGDVPVGYGCWGLGGQEFPLIFDRFVEDVEDVSLLNTNVYPNPSAALGDVLQSEQVFFDAAIVRSVNADVPVDLYAPSNFEPGSSFSHLDEDAFPPGSPNSLMTPFLGRAEAIHNPGAVTCAIFQEMGWELGADCLALVSPGVVAFEAEQVDGGVVLTWQTTPGASIDRFEVQRRYFDDDFVLVETIPAAAGPQAYSTTIEDLDPGRYTFRLRQVYEDGSVLFSEGIEVFVELQDAFFVTGPYPNPSGAASELVLLVELGQLVTVAVYDALGRFVVQLHDGIVRSDGRLVLPIMTDGWTSGVYFLHISARDFRTTRSLVVVR